jgi:hypothetical protein
MALSEGRGRGRGEKGGDGGEAESAARRGRRSWAHIRCDLPTTPAHTLRTRALGAARHPQFVLAREGTSGDTTAAQTHHTACMATRAAPLSPPPRQATLHRTRSPPTSRLSRHTHPPSRIPGDPPSMPSPGPARTRPSTGPGTDRLPCPACRRSAHDSLLVHHAASGPDQTGAGLRACPTHLA